MEKVLLYCALRTSRAVYFTTVSNNNVKLDHEKQECVNTLHVDESFVQQGARVVSTEQLAGWN